jgi:hypothetical protein
VNGRSHVAVLMAASLSLSIGLAGCEPEHEDSAHAVTFPGASGSAEARLTRDVDGAPLLSWLEPDDGEHVLNYARFDGEAFGEVHEVARSERMFVNWADFPSVTPITNTLWFAHWLQLQPDSRGAYDIATAISTDGGSSWSPAEQMNEDNTEAEHGFVSVFGWRDRIAAFWLDGRDLANWSFDDPDALLGTSLRLAEYDASGRVTRRVVADELVCDCCQPDVALVDTGPIVIYRDRTPEEIRDVVVSRYVDGAWSEPVGLGNEGWYIEGCPVNGPVIAARGDDVAAAWFTAADGKPRLRLARSSDAGVSFPVVVDVDEGRALGQAAVVLDESGRALVSWWQRGEAGGIDLKLREVDRLGMPGPEHLIAHESVGQPIDVPQLTDAGDKYLIAWTTLDDGGTVHASLLDL